MNVHGLIVSCTALFMDENPGEINEEVFGDNYPYTLITLLDSQKTHRGSSLKI